MGFFPFDVSVLEISAPEIDLSRKICPPEKSLMCRGIASRSKSPARGGFTQRLAPTREKRGNEAVFFGRLHGQWCQRHGDGQGDVIADSFSDAFLIPYEFSPPLSIAESTWKMPFTRLATRKQEMYAACVRDGAKDQSSSDYSCLVRIEVQLFRNEGNGVRRPFH
jgi:hypothetical protein